MTERKPPGVDFESWVEKQIREAQERGEFDNLPGSGKPLSGLDRPVRENWWLHDYLEREGLSGEALLPVPLRLRKEAEVLRETVGGLRTEAEVRAVVGRLNRAIAEWQRTGTGPVTVVPVDADDVVRDWRAERDSTEPGRTGQPAENGTGHGRSRRRWWRRR
ncbi:molecular chaperone DnaJ [Prauserella marina]|uniref:Uncharacterized protein n=1 Tax=Prauserella marina TaxID=530584 RepID=A0A222VPP7_9PSEU|nr:DUF1992 domain-containing protein [Prauserella marina]ASR35880.1 molecular chaperone DnaJ [Prauserella marina]PWV84200.1 uncharacterized protein DUF1992 [Prauserella marina]SDC28207.1 protein of unknown function [Prauserella marina]